MGAIPFRELEGAPGDRPGRVGQAAVERPERRGGERRIDGLGGEAGLHGAPVEVADEDRLAERMGSEIAARRERGGILEMDEGSVGAEQDDEGARVARGRMLETGAETHWRSIARRDPTAPARSDWYEYPVGDRVESSPVDAAQGEVPACDLLAEAAVALGRASYPTTLGRGLLEGLAEANDFDVDFVVLPNTVVVEDRATGTVAMRDIPGAFRFDQIRDVEVAIADATRHAGDPAASARAIAAVDRQAPLFPPWLRVAGYALAAVGFAAYLRMTPTFYIAAAVLGLIVGAVMVATADRQRITSLLPVALTFGVAFVVVMGAWILDLPDPVRLAAVPVLVLLPGATLTAAIVELVGGDMVSGSSRLLYALMQLIAMSFAFLLAITLVSRADVPLTDYRTAGAVWLAPVGVLLFSVGILLFLCMPWGYWPQAIGVVFAAFIAQSASQQLIPAFLAAGLAAAVALVASWAFDRRHGSGPMAMALFIPAFWMIVPGSMGFVALAGVLARDANLGDLGVDALLTFLAMSIGIMLASLIYPRGANAGHPPDRRLLSRVRR